MRTGGRLWVVLTLLLFGQVAGPSLARRANRLDLAGRPFMPDREAFIAAIAANPADDLPRLVFADWLDENGEGERAEFIRTQIRWHHATEELEKQHLNRRAAELFREHWQQWLRPFLLALDPHADTPNRYEFSNTGHTAMLAVLNAVRPERGPVSGVTHVYLSRGCVSLLGLSLLSWDERWQVSEAFRHEPPHMLQLRLHGSSDDWTRFTHPSLRRIEWLTLTAVPALNPPPSDMLLAFDDPHFAGVRNLTLYPALGADDVPIAIHTGVLARFARSPLAYRLTALSLPGVGDDGVRMLTGSNHRLRLERLELSGTLTTTAVEMLSEAGYGDTVQELRLNAAGLGSRGVAALGRGRWRKLKHLELKGNRLMLGGLRKFTSAAFLNQLVTLDLSDNLLFATSAEKVEHGLRMLSEALSPERLEHLNLSNTALSAVPDFLAERFGDRVMV